MTIQINDTDAIIIIDPQNDFCPGGSLAVAGGDEIMPLINELAPLFRVKVLTRDWHPQDQISFASNWVDETTGVVMAPFSMTEVGYGPQVLWPDHCVQGTAGSDFHPALNVSADAIISKGADPKIDSYSAFFENDQKNATGLGGYLAELGIKRVFLVGLAYDFCVGYSALDAATKLGLQAIIVKDATRAIDLNGSAAAMENNFLSVGVKVIDSSEIVV